MGVALPPDRGASCSTEEGRPRHALVSMRCEKTSALQPTRGSVGSQPPKRRARERAASSAPNIPCLGGGDTPVPLTMGANTK